ncbi:DUF3244 domain-containing protein [Ancylomarina sp. YFZ004]
MKNLKLKLKGLALVALFTLSLNAAFATGNIRINQYLNTDYSIVSVFNTSSTDLKLKIYDENGHVFYSETVEAETNEQKLFDLSHLSDGNYALVLVGKNSRVEETFQVAGKKLLVTNELMQLAENRIKSSNDANKK